MVDRTVIKFVAIFALVYIFLVLSNGHITGLFATNTLPRQTIIQECSNIEGSYRSPLEVGAGNVDLFTMTHESTWEVVIINLQTTPEPWQNSPTSGTGIVYQRDAGSVWLEVDVGNRGGNSDNDCLLSISSQQKQITTTTVTLPQVTTTSSLPSVTTTTVPNQSAPIDLGIPLIILAILGGGFILIRKR